MDFTSDSIAVYMSSEQASSKKIRLADNWTWLLVSTPRSVVSTVVKLFVI